ncbi:hypothetical protein KF840_16735 [bacterium]|nr:hypothetical protein [bacterium]
MLAVVTAFDSAFSRQNPYLPASFSFDDSHVSAGVSAAASPASARLARTEPYLEAATAKAPRVAPRRLIRHSTVTRIDTTGS